MHKCIFSPDWEKRMWKCGCGAIVSLIAGGSDAITPERRAELLRTAKRIRRKRFWENISHGALGLIIILIMLAVLVATVGLVLFGLEQFWRIVVSSGVEQRVFGQ